MTMIELRQTARGLLRSKAFTVTAVSTVAVGIGASAAMFAVFDAALLRPLPYRDSDRIVTIWEERAREDASGIPVAPLDFVDWRERARTFSGLAANWATGSDLTGYGDPERVATGAVSASFFDVLGVTPLLGRAFVLEDEEGPERVVVLSYGLWQRRFGGDRSVVGRRIPVDGSPHVVVGVLPRSFSFSFPPPSQELFRPLVLSEEQETRALHFLTVVGRLAPGATVPMAAEDMARVASELERDYPATNSGHGASVVPMREFLSRDVRPALAALLASTIFVLLIGCTNVASLFLARGGDRSRELVLRSALGAGGFRLAVPLLAESLFIAILGGGLGVLLSLWSLDAIRRLLPVRLPLEHAMEASIDGRVLAFALALSTLTALVTGVVPALRLTRTKAMERVLRGSGRASSAPAPRARRTLVVAEVALALLLLAGATLLAKSFLSLLSEPPGFDPEGVVTLRLSLPDSRYDRDRQASFFSELLDRVRPLPGVERVGAVSFLPFGSEDARSGIEIEGRVADPEEPTRAHIRSATAGYFETLRIPLVAGRLIGPEDGPAGRAVVVNESMARRYWPEMDPIGRRVRLAGDDVWREVVGVVSDVKHWGLSEDFRPEMFFPQSQRPFRSMTIVLRARVALADLLPAVRAEVRSVDAALPLTEVETMTDRVDGSIAARRSQTLLFTFFAAAALLLAAIGVYGVVAYSVALRAREIGIRTALGAPSHRIQQMVIREGLTLVVLGVGLGLAGALLLSRFLQGMLFRVSPTEPGLLALAAGLWIAIALAACYVPARRAASVDPMVVLRSE